MERKDRLYWRHPKTKSPDETNRPNIDWIIKAQYASQLATYFIERKHIQRKGLSPRKHIQMKWLSQLRFLWHLELQVLSSFLHLQAFVLHLDLQVHLNTPCPLFMLWSLAASLTPTSSSSLNPSSSPPPPNHPRTKELKRILVSSRVTNKVEIDDVSQTLSTFLTGMNFPNYLASLEKSSE